MKPCPKCHAQISEEAATCPKCGHKLTTTAGVFIAVIIGLVGGGLLLALILPK